MRESGALGRVLTRRSTQGVLVLVAAGGGLPSTYIDVAGLDIIRNENLEFAPG